MQGLNNESANAPIPVTVHRVGASGAGDHSGFPLRHVPYGQEPRQKLDVYLPRKARVKSTIVFLYGGGWVSGARWYYRLFGRAMAARGHVVVIPDYRLFPQVRFPTFNEDAALAVKWTSDNLLRLGGHPSRLFLMGHSAGAHISVTLALDGSYLAAHDLAPSDIAGVIGLAGPYTLDPLKWKGIKDIFASSSGSASDQARAGGGAFNAAAAWRTRPGGRCPCQHPARRSPQACGHKRAGHPLPEARTFRDPGQPVSGLALAVAGAEER
jgi:pimeloyl-ACP methyl ester carboxylesterase